MKIQRFFDPRQFYAQTKDYLLQQEAMHNLQLGICVSDRFIHNSDTDTANNYLATVIHGEEILGVVMRTPPFHLLLSMMTNLDVIPAIIADVRDFYGSISGVNAPANISKTFAKAWCDTTGNTYRLQRGLGVFQLEQVQPPRYVPGELRLVTEHERELLKTWFVEFSYEALGTLEICADTWVKAQLEQKNAYFWWDSAPVSMACCNRSTPNGVTISPVYTPPTHRDRGYASNCVAALSQNILNRGAKYCFLFTDLANPTSNHIYQKIGYQPVGEWQEFSFVS